MLVGGSRPPRGPTAFQLAAFASEKHPDVFPHAWIGRPGAEGADGRDVRREIELAYRPLEARCEPVLYDTRKDLYGFKHVT